MPPTPDVELPTPTHQHSPAAHESTSETSGGASLPSPNYQINTGDENAERRSGFFNGLGDLLNMREGEAELDAYESYLDSMEEKREFLASTHSKLTHRPSTGMGKFDVHYNPNNGNLIIAIRYSLNFIDGSATDFPDATAESLTWDDEAKSHWESEMQRQIYSAWSGHFSFHCQKDYWEDLSANTSVVAYKDESDPHFQFNVRKIPKHNSDGDLTFSGSSVNIPNSSDNATPATLDSNDIEGYDKLNSGSNLQYPIVHEAGHMLGLGDEYHADRRDGTPWNYSDSDHDHMVEDYGHANLVDETFDTEVTVGSDDRIMSSGDQVNPEHGVTFLEALKAATDMEEWDYEAKAPKEIPVNPDAPVYQDYIPPRTDVMYA